MGRFEIAGTEESLPEDVAESADAFYELGMKYSVGRSVSVDLVAAHKWFNLAAMRGNQDAIQLRREMAAQMTDAEIGQAQRAARDWLKAHPPAAAGRPDVRAAA